MAKVTVKTQKIFLLYNPINVTNWLEEGEDVKGKEKGNEINTPKDDKTVFYVIIGISSFLLVVIVVIIVIVLYNKYKNQDLLKKVNKVSFVEDKGDDNLLGDDNVLN